MTEQQKERLDKPALLDWLDDQIDSAVLIRHEVGYRRVLEGIQSGKFDTNDSEAIKGWGECEAQNQQLREESERITKEREKWEAEARLQYRLYNEMIEESRVYREEKEQVKKERDFYKHVRDPHETLLSLRSELAAKDKALQMIANAKVHSCDSAYQLTQIAQQAIGVTHET